MIVEITRQRLRRGRIDGACLRRVEFDVFDRALLVLEAAQRFDQRFRRLEASCDRAGNLASQRHPPLVGNVALLREAELADHRLKALRIELAVDTLEVRIAEDEAHGLSVGLPEPQPSRILVKGCLRDRLLQHLAVEAERAGLLRRQRAAELAADLLQPIGVELTELIERDLDVADFCQGRLSESPENIGNAPDAETDNQHAHHHGHNSLAEPV